MKKTFEEHPLSRNPIEGSLEIEIPQLDLANKSIAIFTIGPVQSFIAAAKKVKELWAGSYLLSFLAWKGLEVVIQRAGEDRIIFPLVKEQPFYKRFICNNYHVENIELATIPNRFMALLDQDYAKVILEECEERVKEELLEITSLRKENRKNKLIERQINELLEIYWICLPLKSSYEEERERFFNYKGLEDQKISSVPNSLYGLATTFAEELLGSRKALRNFTHVKEEGVKCFICGERGAIVYGAEKKKICGICDLKRDFSHFFHERISKSNHSVRHYQPIVEIASMDYKEALVENLRGSPQVLKELVSLFKEEIIAEDPELDYPPLRWVDYSSLEKELLRYKGDVFDLEGNAFPQKSRSYALLKKINQDYSLRLNKYYALLYLDGDDMGQWVSGDKTGTISPEIHSMISKSLTDYSLRSVKKIVEGDGRKGWIVYAGGDDLVAFVNLSDLFSIIRELRAYFSGHVKNGDVNFQHREGILDLDGEQILTLGYKATLSLGVCIAHYKEPLNLVTRKAQAMEKLAKKVVMNSQQKDALALGLLKHSGEIREAVVKWHYDQYDTIKDGLEPMVKLVREEKISRSFVYQLKEGLELLEGREFLPLVEAEVERLVVKRKCQENDYQEVERVVKGLLTVYQNPYWLTIRREVNTVQNFIALLEILFFLGKRGE